MFGLSKAHVSMDNTNVGHMGPLTKINCQFLILLHVFSVTVIWSVDVLFHCLEGRKGTLQAPEV